MNARARKALRNTCRSEILDSLWEWRQVAQGIYELIDGANVAEARIATVAAGVKAVIEQLEKHGSPAAAQHRERLRALTMPANASAALRKTSSEMCLMPVQMAPRATPGKMYALLP